MHLNFLAEENQQMFPKNVPFDKSNVLQSDIDDLFSLFIIPNKESLDKSKDTDILSQIRQSIIDYETEQSQIKSTLKIIGHLSSQITYNDTNDPNSQYIRNQYGFIRRNKDKSINKNGIYFESLSYLKIILSDDMIGTIITDDEWNDLGTELIFLKQKIDLILSEQKFKQNSANEKSFNQSNIDISKLADFSKKYYDQVILRRIIYELDHMESIDFRIKEDRYYFGRIYSIIGELFNEWLQYQENVGKDNVLKTLKKFIKLRDGLVHHHERINSLSELDNESINEIIVKLRNHLRKIIVVSRVNRNFLEIDFDYACIEDFNNLLSRLSSLMSRKSKKIHPDINVKDSEKSVVIEKALNKLHRCIYKACEILEEKIMSSDIETKLSNMSIDDQLQLINDNYQKNIHILSAEERNHFPRRLDRENMEKIKLCRNYLASNKSISLENSDGFSNNDQDLHNKGIKSLRNHTDMNSSVYSSKLVERFLKKITFVIDEMNYLFHSIPIFNNEDRILLGNKTRYIMEHSMLVIGQMVRDIENVNICQFEHNGNHQISNDSSTIDHIFGLISSDLIGEISSRSKTLRNQGLAHNIWNFDEDLFNKGLRQIESAFPHVQLYYYIIMGYFTPEDAESLYVIGVSLMYITENEKAIEYLEKCRTRLTDYPHNVENAIFLIRNDLEKIYQMNPFVWNTLIHLSDAYSKVIILKSSKNCSEKSCSEISIEIALYLLEHVDYDEDSDIDILSFQSFLKDLCKIFTLLKDHLDPNVYIELLESFDERYGNCIFTLAIAEFYERHNNYGKAKEVLKYMIENCLKIDDKITPMAKYSEICLEEHDKDKTSEIVTFLDTLEEIHNNETELTRKTLWKYSHFRAVNISAWMKLILENLSLEGINESELSALRKLSIQYKEMFKKFQITGTLFGHFVVNDFIDGSWVFVVILSLDIGNGLDPNFMPIVFDRDILAKYPNVDSNSIQNENMATLNNVLLHLINKAQELKQTNHNLLGKLFSMKISGDCLYQYGEWFLTIFRNNNKNRGAKSLSEIFNKYAIKCFKEFCNGSRDYPHDLIMDARVKLCYCHSSLAILDCDLLKLESIICERKMMIKLSKSYKVDMKSFEQLIKSLEYIRDQTLSIINKILEAPDDNFNIPFHEEFAARYLKIDFNIRVNKNGSGKNWIYEGTFDQLKKQIRWCLEQDNIFIKRFYISNKSVWRKITTFNSNKFLPSCRNVTHSVNLSRNIPKLLRCSCFL